jgi:hypothetical protein
MHERWISYKRWSTPVGIQFSPLLLLVLIMVCPIRGGSVLKLHGSSFSACTQRVAIVLMEKKIPFQFFEVDMKSKEHETPEYLEKNPFGQVCLFFFI